MAKKRTTDSFDLERRAFNGDEKAQRILERRRKEYNKQLDVIAKSRINELKSQRQNPIQGPKEPPMGIKPSPFSKNISDEERKKLEELKKSREKHESGKTVNGVVYVSAYTRSKPGRR